MRAASAWRERLARSAIPEQDSGRIDLIAELERVKSAAAAVQARLTAALAADATARAGTRDGKAQALRSVAGQVGLARRISPARAVTVVGLARMLCTDLPDTLHALSRGEIGEWRATLVARELVTLSATDRRVVDARLAAALGQLGDRGVAREARRLADLTDPSCVARRVKAAEAERRVTVRPAPGPAGCAMARLTATMPVAQAVAAYAALRARADAARSAGDRRSLGQLMSDILFTQLASTSGGNPGALGGAGSAAGVNVEIGLVMSERTLFRGGGDPALLTDVDGRAWGTVPAVLARRLARSADRSWLTRLYARPDSGELVAMDSRRRTFTGRLRRLLIWRDQTCRTPWCEAPIRHADHVQPHARGGPTDLTNAAGLCEACNYLKQAPGWRTDLVDRAGLGGQVIRITTPAGHQYDSPPPRAPGHQEQTLEETLSRRLDDWDDGCEDDGRAGAA